MTLIKSISGIRGTIGGKVGIHFQLQILCDLLFMLPLLGKVNKSNTIIGRDARVSGKMVSSLVSEL